MELLPEFTTKMFILFLLALNGSNNNGIENIIYRAAAAQIIYRFIQSLQHRANGQCTCFPLHGFVRIVACIKIRKYQYGMPCRQLQNPVIFDGLPPDQQQRRTG